MKKKTIIILLTAALGSTVALAGCGSNTSTEAGTDSTDTTNTTTESTVGEDTAASSETSDLFAAMANYQFEYASGAGAWGTELTVDADGSFTGLYHDSDMGDSGEGYPDGTVYVCNFTGKFTTPEQVDEHTYKTTIESITSEKEEGTEELADNMRYVYSAPAGLSDAEDIYIYTPGAVIADLPEGYQTWISFASDGETTLSYYGIYNEKGEAGFYSYDYSDFGNEEESLYDTGTTDIETYIPAESAIGQELAKVEEQAKAIDTKLETENLTQAEMDELAEQQYKLWDEELNSIWKRLKETMDEEDMTRLTQEEKAWIAEKDAQVKEAGAEYEGGSLQSMVMSTKAAELTRAQVYELAKNLI